MTFAAASFLSPAISTPFTVKKFLRKAASGFEDSKDPLDLHPHCYRLEEALKL